MIMLYSLSVGQGFFQFIRCVSVQYFSLYATKALHYDMIKKVVQAPINLYFDTI